MDSTLEFGFRVYGSAGCTFGLIRVLMGFFVLIECLKVSSRILGETIPQNPILIESY